MHHREKNQHRRTSELGFFREQISREEKLLEQKKRRGPEPDAIFRPARSEDYRRAVHTSTGVMMADVSNALRAGEFAYEAVSRRAPKFREPERWQPSTARRGKDRGPKEKRTDAPAASIDTGPPRTYRRPAKEWHEVGAKEEAELLGRLAEIESERDALLASLARNDGRKDRDHRYRGNCNTFLDTYRPPDTSRCMLLPGETHGKIYSH